MSRLDRIQILLEELGPSHLQVSDFSHEHSGRSGSESHIKIVIAGDIFQGKNRVQRHRMIYGRLNKELEAGLHALQLHIFTEEELEMAEIEPPPRCKGGTKRGAS